MAATAPTFVTYERDGRRVLTVSGDFDAAWSNRLVSEFGAAAESLAHGHELVVDLSGLASFDDRALPTLRRCSLLADAFGLRWHVIVPRGTGRALDLAGVDSRSLPIVRLVSGT